MTGSVDSSRSAPHSVGAAPGGSTDKGDYDGGDDGDGRKRQCSVSLPRLRPTLASGEAEDCRRSGDGRREAEPEDDERNDGKDPDDQAAESGPRYARNDAPEQDDRDGIVIALAMRK